MGGPDPAEQLAINTIRTLAMDAVQADLVRATEGPR